MSNRTRNQRKTNSYLSYLRRPIKISFTNQYSKPMSDLMSAWTNHALTVISEATIDSEMLVKPSKARLRYLKAGDKFVV